MGKNKYGNVYEIALSNGKYVYVCWIEQFSFGIFDYISEESLTDISCLLTLLLLKCSKYPAIFFLFI